MWIKGAAKGFMALSLFISFNAGQAMADAPVLHPAIPLYDENGNHVLDSKKPYSSKKSCGNNGGSGCHDYDAITKAYHFEFGRDEAGDDFGPKRGLSRLVSPGYYGGYNCMGGNNNPVVLAKKSNKAVTDFADWGSAGWIMRCNGCHQGGGWMEKDRNGKRYDETDPNSVTALDGDYFNRGTDSSNKTADSKTVSQWDWKKSGVAEADCMMCHGDFTKFKKFDAQLNGTGSSDALTHFRTLRGTYLAAQGLFRYMGTAILEFMNLNTTADTAKDMSAVVFSRYTSMPSGNHLMVHNTTKPMYYLALNAENQPVVKWNMTAFDANRKIAIPMLRFPGNDNCMNCHRTSNGRRGFYGLGEAAAATYDGDGNIVPDYKDDVHKGKVWTENGVARSIDNCNTCHSRGYFKGYAANADLDANHDIPKGNSEMTIRDDLDYSPRAKSCMYCHNDAPTPAIPSGHKDMLSAHRERWKASGDMSGYPQDTLNRITQTHLDVIACQTCHINGIKNNGIPIRLMYRYRVEEDGAFRIFPYNPTVRYYWKDKVTGYMLNATERNSVFTVKPDPNDGKKNVGVITDPLSGKELGTVPATVSHGAPSFGHPATYEAIVGLKQAYDSLMKKTKGVSNADTAMVWTETAEYIITHNTRPAVSSVQCAECHNKKQDGSFSSLIRPDGLLGETPITISTSLPEKTLPIPDRKLIDNGIVILDLPYMKLDSSGVVKENISDILYASKLNPSLSVLNAAKSKVALFAAKQLSIDSAAGLAKVANIAKIKEFLATQNVFFFAPGVGDDKIKAVAIMAEADTTNKLLLPTYKMEVSLADDAVLQASSRAGFGGVVGSVFSLKAFDANSQDVTTFTGNGLLVKIPYDGKNTSLDQVKIITSSDGSTWTAIPKEDVKLIETGTADAQGYIVFATSHFSYFAVADSTTTGGGTTASGGSSGSSGFCFIATAAYGSYEEPHVQILREFRDRILMTNRIGDAFVKFYYTVSPPAAEWIAKHDGVRAVVRVMLLPLFALAWFLLKLSVLEQILAIASMALGGYAACMLIRRRRAVIEVRHEG